MVDLYFIMLEVTDTFFDVSKLLLEAIEIIFIVFFIDLSVSYF